MQDPILGALAHPVWDVQSRLGAAWTGFSDIWSISYWRLKSQGGGFPLQSMDIFLRSWSSEVVSFLLVVMIRQKLGSMWHTSPGRGSAEWQCILKATSPLAATWTCYFNTVWKCRTFEGGRCLALPSTHILHTHRVNGILPLAEASLGTHPWQGFDPSSV